MKEIKSRGGREGLVGLLAQITFLQSKGNSDNVK